MASDSFTDANDTALEVHDSNWTRIGDGNYAFDVDTLEIQNNCVQIESAWIHGAAFYIISSVDLSQIVFKAKDDGALLRRVAVRMADGVRGYSARFDQASAGNFTRVEIAKNGNWLATAGAGTWASNVDHTVKVTASGTTTVTITAFIDGTAQGTTGSDSSSPLGAGSPGFWVAGSSEIADTVMDDWTDGAAGGANASLNLSQNLGFTDLAEATAAANANLAMVLGLSDLSQAEAKANVSFSSGLGLSDQSQAVTDAALALAKVVGITISADVVADATLTIATHLAFITNVGAEYVNVGLSQSLGLSAQADTTAGAALTLAYQIALGFVGQADAIGIVSLALQKGISTTCFLSCESALTLAQSLGCTNSAQAVSEGGLTIGQSLSIATIAQALAEANLSLSCVKSLTIVGQRVVAVLIAPNGRAVTVAAEVRFLTVAAEDRIITVS